MKHLFFRNGNIGLLLIRLGLAAVFIIAGLAKFMNITDTTSFFQKAGLPEFIVYVVATVELLGGIAMLLGVFTRIFGWLLAINMAFAMYFVSFKMGFTIYRLDLMLLLASAGIALTGAGYYALCKGDCDFGK